VSQIIAIFEAKDYSEEDPETSLKVRLLMNKVGSPLKSRNDDAESARNRCKSMVLRQRKLWVNFHQGWHWEQMGSLSFPKTVV